MITYDNSKRVVIPKNKPHKLFHRELYNSSEYNIPAFSGSNILISQGYFDDHEPGNSCPVLIALDRRTGQEVFQVEVLSEGYQDVYGGVPAVQENGIIWLPVYQRNHSLKVLQLDPTGKILQGQEDELGDERQTGIINFDSGDKFRITPLAIVNEDTYLLSWLRRQREYQIECRKLGQKKAVWSALEYMLEITENVVLTVTRPQPRLSSRPYEIEEWVLSPYKPDLNDYLLRAREKKSGEIIWSLPAAHKVLAAVSPGAFLIVDRTLRVFAHARRRDIFETDWITQAYTVPDFPKPEIYANEFYQQHRLNVPSVLIMIAEEGNELWRLKLEGDIVSAVCGNDYIGLILASESGAGQFICLNLAGQILWREPLIGPSYWSEWPPAAYKWPVLIAIDGASLLWGTQTELSCSSLIDPGKINWQLELPVPNNYMVYGEWWTRYLDRHLNRTNVVVREQTILIHCGTLWVYSDKEEAAYHQQ